MDSSSSNEQNPPLNLVGSSIRVEQGDDAITIHIPRLRFSRYGYGLCFGTVFAGLPAGLVGLLLYRVLANPEVAGDVDLTGIVCIITFLSIFILAGLTIVSISLGEATRRDRIRIERGQLSVLQTSLFRRWQETWPLGEVRSVKAVHAEDLNYPERYNLRLGLSAPGDFRNLAQDRTQAEMEWLAGLLRPYLERDEEEDRAAAKQPTPAPDEPVHLLSPAGDPTHHFLPGETSDLEREIAGAVVCSRCDSVHRIDQQRLTCENCAAPLKLKDEAGTRRQFVGSFAAIERFIDFSHRAQGDEQIWYATDTPSMRQQVAGSVQCGWCDQFFQQRPGSPNCTRCGGVLPLPSSSEPGPPPPETPRALPLGFVIRMHCKYNRIGLFAAVLVVASIPLWCLNGQLGLVPLVAGLALGYLAYLRRFRRYRALRRGRAVLGRIETVHSARSDVKDRLHRVYYRFEIGDRPVRGVKWSYSPNVLNHFVGQPVWVVYLERNPICNDLWPPFN